MFGVFSLVDGGFEFVRDEFFVFFRRYGGSEFSGMILACFLGGRTLIVS